MEVLIVIAIVAILSAILVWVLNPKQILIDSRNAKRKADIRQIFDAIQFFGLKKQLYPQEHWWDTSMGCGMASGDEPAGNYWNAGNCPPAETLDQQTKDFLSLPVDPQNYKQDDGAWFLYDYQGIWVGGGECCIAFSIAAHLEPSGEPWMLCAGPWQGTWLDVPDRCQAQQGF